VPITCRALVAVDGNDIVGVAGIYHRVDGLVMFAELGPEVLKQPRLIIKAYRKLLDWVRESRLPVHSVADETIPNSAKFLEHIGFKCLYDNIYEWVP
jgi:hypothetical protein